MPRRGRTCAPRARLALAPGAGRCRASARPGTPQQLEAEQCGPLRAARRPRLRPFAVQPGDAGCGPLVVPVRGRARCPAIRSMAGANAPNSPEPPASPQVGPHGPGRAGRSCTTAGMRAIVLDAVRVGMGPDGVGGGQSRKILCFSGQPGGLSSSAARRRRIAGSGSAPRAAARLSGLLVAGITQHTVGWPRMNLRQTWAQLVAPVSAAQSGSGRPRSPATTRAWRMAIDRHRDAALGGQRRQAVFGLARGQRVVELGEVDAFPFHRPRQLGMGAGVVMVDADVA